MKLTSIERKILFDKYSKLMTREEAYNKVAEVEKEIRSLKKPKKPKKSFKEEFNELIK